VLVVLVVGAPSVVDVRVFSRNWRVRDPGWRVDLVTLASTSQIRCAKCERGHEGNFGTKFDIRLDQA
jgi:hypothetical protein